MTTVGGRYGTDYLLRAAWASSGWPSQLPTSPVCPSTFVDSTGRSCPVPITPMTFPKGRLPPVNPLAFWSITMYISDNGQWFYPNPLDKRR
ncbi:MAG: hypothetical protein H6988_05090 [Pseudomonadales bacterium]|nr:hypothetical protein [Pseudomonadales bacterium]